MDGLTHCYSLLLNSNALEAQTACPDSSHLATVDNSDENHFIAALSSASKSLYSKQFREGALKYSVVVTIVPVVE